MNNKTGFTLIELMVSTLLASIVMMAIGGMLVSFWVLSSQFMSERQTMQEIIFFSDLYHDNTRALTTVADVDLGNHRLKFDSGREIAFESDSVVYDNGTSRMELLEKSVISHATPVITNGSLIKLELDIVEPENNKTNNYKLYVMPRNS